MNERRSIIPALLAITMGNVFNLPQMPRVYSSRTRRAMRNGKATAKKRNKFWAKRRAA